MNFLQFATENARTQASPQTQKHFVSYKFMKHDGEVEYVKSMTFGEASRLLACLNKAIDLHHKWATLNSEGLFNFRAEAEALKIALS